MEGNHIDREELRDAGKPSGTVKTLADSSVVQPFYFSHLFHFSVSLMGLSVQRNRLAIIMPIMLALVCRRREM